MKLSEAIRLGAMLKPQCFGLLRKDGGTCALGAADEAAGFPADVIGPPLLALRYRFGWAWAYGENQNIVCPACGEERIEPAGVITHLNDEHEWTREQIADWVETIEPKEAPAVEMESSMELIEG